MAEQWTRQHDRIIAERCEGKTILTEEELRASFFKLPAGWSSGNLAYYEDTGIFPWKEVPHYNTDIAACFRAAEAWQAKDPDHRSYNIDAGPVRKYGSAYRYAVRFEDVQHYSHGETLMVALAWALYEAVTNAEAV